MSGWVRAAPYVLFVLSGLAGLVLEAVLLRQLSWTFGSTARATALVLSAFMGGLALGAWWFGRIADRSDRPLALFGWPLYLSKIAGRRNAPMGKSTSSSGHDPVRVRTSAPLPVRRIVSSDLAPVMEGFQVRT